MELQILGSGGFLPIPRATCQCRICKKARQKGGFYRRRGPALYLNDVNVLIDTPEDINESLNFNEVNNVDTIIYTHWHPDHTLGYRVIETICDQDFFKKKKTVKVYIPSYDWNNFKKFVPGLWYLESRGYAEIKKIPSKGVRVKGIHIKPIRLKNTTFSAFMITQQGKKTLLCPDHSMSLPMRDEYKNVSLLIINMGFFEDNLKGLKKMPLNHRLRKSTGFEKDNLRIINELKPKKTILMHIDEKFNRSNDDLNILERKYKDLNIKFATDGLQIKI